MSKNESVIWKFCTKLGKLEEKSDSHPTARSSKNPVNEQVFEVRCDLCKITFKQHRGCTSTMLKHLKAQHGKQFYTVVNPDGTIFCMLSFQEVLVRKSAVYFLSIYTYMYMHALLI